MNLLISNLRGILRIILFLIILISYFIVAGLIYFFNSNLNKRRRKLINNTQVYCSLMMKIFSVKLICKNPISSDENSLVVGNHMGFIDVACIQKIQPAVFITSIEMKNTPVLGWISELAGCSYVDRRNRQNIENELRDIVNVLKNNFRVALYPEAAATNGEQVLPFKKTLMMAGPLSGKPIRPYVFNYKAVENRSIKFSDRDSLCWYGDLSFKESIWRTLKLKSITCEIEFLPLMYFKPEDDRTFVAESVHKVISEKFIPFKI